MTSEEEQLNQLKSWWKENGLSTIGAIAIAIAVTLGWQGWKNNHAAKLEASSLVYQQFLAAVAESEQSAGDDIKIAQATFLANQLKEEHEGTGFSFFAALFNAKQAMADKDYTVAAEEIQWVLDRAKEPEIQAVAKMRLARIYTAQSDYDKALSTASEVEGVTFEPISAELRGDIYMAQLQYQSAFDAYSQAQETAQKHELELPPTLTAKLQYAQSFL